MVIQEKRVAVTGMAWTTALGDNLDVVWSNLKKGLTGLSKFNSKYPIRNELAGIINFSENNLSPAKKIKALTKLTVERAINDAEISSEDEKVFLIIGTSFGSRLDDESNDSLLHDWIEQIAIDLNLIPISVSTACSSASDAILIGHHLIKSGIAKKCVCGGADILGYSKLLAHSALGTMSTTSLSSFDQGNNGTILGEGAGFLVLEEHHGIMTKNIYAYLNGCGSANDAAGLTSPDKNGDGIMLAIERSLCDAKLNIKDIKLVNAHGSGTRINDAVETKVYNNLFSNSSCLIFATKGAFGHTLGATGALEAMCLIMALNNKFVPPIYNLSNPNNDISFTLPDKNGSFHSANYGLSLTIGFGGFNTSLIFEKGSLC